MPMGAEGGAFAPLSSYSLYIFVDSRLPAVFLLEVSHASKQQPGWTPDEMSHSLEMTSLKQPFYQENHSDNSNISV